MVASDIEVLAERIKTLEASNNILAAKVDKLTDAMNAVNLSLATGSLTFAAKADLETLRNSLTGYVRVEGCQEKMTAKQDSAPLRYTWQTITMLGSVIMAASAIGAMIARFI